MNKFNKTKNTVYLDHASSANFASSNPSAIHALGVQEKNKLENVRKKVADILHAHSDEVVFTSGATESNNLAILGLVSDFNKPHIVTTNIEHASVLELCKHLEETKRATVTYVEVGNDGIVDPKKIKKAIKENTVLESVMYANNEIGTIQPIQEIAKEIRHYNKRNRKMKFLEWSSDFFRGPEKNLHFPVSFHTDATQAVNYLSINVAKLGVDLMSFNGAKIYGPKGVGVLYVKKNTPIKKIMFGGDQEHGLRPGTENVSGITELAFALEHTEKIKEREVARLSKLREYFINKLSNISHAHEINGDLVNRLPNNINITFPNIPSDLLVIELSAHGIMSSAKSACKSGDGKASHVIQAINKNIKDTDGSLRFSLGRDTAKHDIDYTITVLKNVLQKLEKWYN